MSRLKPDTGGLGSDAPGTGLVSDFESGTSALRAVIRATGPVSDFESDSGGCVDVG